jgi:hypothetical protein
MCHGGASDAGFSNMEDEDAEETRVPMHTFPLLVRIPLNSDKDNLSGIATSSCVDDT